MLGVESENPFSYPFLAAGELHDLNRLEPGSVGWGVNDLVPLTADLLETQDHATNCNKYCDPPTTLCGIIRPVGKNFDKLFSAIIIKRMHLLISSSPVGLFE